MRTKPLCLCVFIALSLGIIVGNLLLKAESVSIFASVPGLSGFTTGSDGTVYALSGTDDRIVLLGPDGRILGSIGPLLEGGYSLKISPFYHPVHVDESGRIYIPSKGYLLILNSAGHIINVDSSGKLLKGFDVGTPSWVGTTKRGNIYVHPAIDDENSLISIITPEGTRLPEFGDTIFPREESTNTLFHVAMTEDDTLYAVLSNFPAMLKYRSDQSFDSLIKLYLSDGLEQVIKSHDMSIDEALQRLSKRQPIRARENHLIFTDVESVDANTLVCVSSAQILWYNESGTMLRKLDQVRLMALTRFSIPISDVTTGCSGRCLFVRAQRNDAIYRIDF